MEERRGLMNTKSCANCKKEFMAKTPQHKFCCATCSMAYYRKVKIKERDQKWVIINADR
jgi:hypothetical protein